MDKPIVAAVALLGLGLLAACGLSDTQRQNAERCAIDAGGKVVVSIAGSSTTDAGALAVNSALAAGSTLLSDQACKDLIASLAAARSAKGLAPPGK